MSAKAIHLLADDIWALRKKYKASGDYDIEVLTELGLIVDRLHAIAHRKGESK